MTCLTCPHCGYDLRQVERLQLGDLEIVSGCEIRWKGQRVKLSQSRTLIVLALVKAAGAWVRSATLADVCGYDGDDPARLIDVHICWIRKAFRVIDPGFDQIEREGQGRAGSGQTRWRAEFYDGPAKSLN